MPGARVAGVVALLLLATACSSEPASDADRDTGPVRGGELTVLTSDQKFTHLDPQRTYYGEEMAFASSFLTRTLTAYALSPGSREAGTLVPDLATDTGKPNADRTTWSWRLKDGLTWQDGSELTCKDIKYGVSRTFATEVVTDGPQYAVSMLDIPTDSTGASIYRGPYERRDEGSRAFDKAVVCDGPTITFHLNRPVADFNYTVALTAFGPVPEAADDGDAYDRHLVSSGPYKIHEYEPGEQLVLVRNHGWNAATHDRRRAYPDRVVVRFGISSSVIDHRMIKDSGVDRR